MASIAGAKDVQAGEVVVTDYHQPTRPETWAVHSTAGMDVR